MENYSFLQVRGRPEVRPEAHRHLRHDGLAKVCRLLRQRPLLHHPRPHLPRRRPLLQEPRRGLRRRRSQADGPGTIFSAVMLIV